MIAIKEITWRIAYHVTIEAAYYIVYVGVFRHLLFGIFFGVFSSIFSPLNDENELALGSPAYPTDRRDASRNATC